jgi:two-component system, cell cycle response regulator
MKVLIADDALVSARLLESYLSGWGYQVITAGNGNEAWDVLQGEDSPGLVILDWMMPGLNGVEICRAVRKQAREPYTYILLLTSREKEQDIVEGLEAGADDFLTKPFRPLELKARLGTGRRILNLQEALITAREELKTMATHDVLTGIWNRKAILDHLQSELARCERLNLSVGVIMGDLDHFKQINDTFGHAVGDAVLCETARRLRNSMRTYDAVGRYGGEEFLIVVPECNTDSLSSVAERICSGLRDNPFLLSGTELTVTISLGVAACNKANEDHLKLLLETADQSLYRAKRAGRNRFDLVEI